MDELQDLRELVGKLEQAETNQVEILQDIGKELVSHYVIKLPGNIIQPLWVEAYYADIDDMRAYKENIGEKFIDPFIHGADEQKGKENFGKLYFHHKTDDQRSGVDICLPCGSYYLSFLLKYTLVNDVFTTQSQLSGKIREAYKDKESILYRVDDTTECVLCTSRIRLETEKEKDPVKKEQKEKYKLLPLAVLPVNAIIKYDMTQFGEVRKSLAENAVQYIAEFKKENPSLNKKDYEQECRRVFGWLPDSVGKLLKGLA